MVARTVKQPWISSMGIRPGPGPGPGPSPEHQYRHRYCSCYYIITLLFLCLVILLDVAGADSGYNGYKMGLNHRGVHDPPNFDFVTKKQEKFNLNSIPPLNRQSSSSSVEESLMLSSENSAGENFVNSAEEAGISGNGNFVEPDPNPNIVTTAEESLGDNLDSSSNSNQIQYQDLSSNAESSLENLTPSDSQGQEQDETKQLDEIILESGSDEKEIQRIARRISGLSQTHPRPLQNQYPNPSVRHQNNANTDRKFEGWKVIDDDERGGSSGDPVWHGSGTRSRNPSVTPNRHPNSISNPNGPSPGTVHPNGKTIGPLPSLPSLDIVEDPGYDHGPRPKWPLNEYLVDKFNSFYRPNFYENTRNKTEVNGPTKHAHQHQQLHQQGWQWQQLQPHRQHQPQHFGSSASESHHNFDSTKFYHLDEDDFGNQDQTRYWSNDNLYNTNLYGNHGHGHKQAYSYRGYNSPHREHQSGTNGHETSVSTTAEVGKGISNDGVTSTSTSARDVVKHHGHDHGPHGHAHYFPPDYYPKKRFRLQIHPGYIAAPIAGLAAFGAASALTKKPLLFELGLVNNKHHYPKPIHYPGGYPGHHHHGWASNLVPNYYPAAAHSGNGLSSGGLGFGSHPGVGDGPVYPIIKPEASHHHKPVVHSHGHNHQHSHNHNHNFGWAQLQSQNQNQNQQNHHHHHGHGHENCHHGHGHALHHQHHHSGGEGDKKPWWNPFAALTPRD